MTLIESMVPAVEVYSIDKAFADLTGISNLDALGRRIRSQVLRCTGTPVGVGRSHEDSGQAREPHRKTPSG